ncbi:hypothetical protein Moror_9582 [Moniliophthora roreri MCA 2997]|uniref:Uncharacterized protein n=1 Tax=Moniliophthora roreri (strain MCA 2997) TaxID=1381753 RepID=V2WW54_MONRO|nr:hypothetical protein Moror_9582 [Moniliophthora roreri MCA 2997]
MIQRCLIRVSRERKLCLLSCYEKNEIYGTFARLAGAFFMPEGPMDGAGNPPRGFRAENVLIDVVARSSICSGDQGSCSKAVRPYSLNSSLI